MFTAPSVSDGEVGDSKGEPTRYLAGNSSLSNCLCKVEFSTRIKLHTEAHEPSDATDSMQSHENETAVLRSGFVVHRW